MRCYLVEGGGRIRYAGTQADAKAKRDEIMSATDSKRKDVTINETEIPAPKPELLEFINGLCEKLDA